MELEFDQIKSNWEQFITNINIYISGERKQQLIDFYLDLEEQIFLYPAAHKKEYHNAIPGGYVDHVNRVVDFSIDVYRLWKEKGADVSGFTIEELVFSAINHDLGKLGEKGNPAYIEQTDQWRKEKLGEDYTFNTKLPFVSVPDRSLFLLQEAGIRYSLNEMLAIQTHDGLYDEANKKYLMGWAPEQKPRTALPFILHQADMMAARIEFEREWNGKFDKTPIKKEKSKKVNKKQQDALKTVSSPGLKTGIQNLLDEI